MAIIHAGIRPGPGAAISPRPPGVEPFCESVSLPFSDQCRGPIRGEMLRANHVHATGSTPVATCHTQKPQHIHMVQRLLNNASKQHISDTEEQLPPIFWGGRWQKTRAMIVYISPQSFRKQACLIDGLAPFVHQIP